MKNNIKKASVNFWEDLLYFQHSVQILSLPQISDYHHLKFLISIQFKTWLVGCLGLNGPLRQYFSLYQDVPQREGEI